MLSFDYALAWGEANGPSAARSQARGARDNAEVINANQPGFPAGLTKRGHGLFSLNGVGDVD